MEWYAGIFQTGDMEYSYRLVSVVSHFGSSNAGQYRIVVVQSR